MERENSQAQFDPVGVPAAIAVLEEVPSRARFAFQVPRVVDHFALAFVLYFLV